MKKASLTASTAPFGIDSETTAMTVLSGLRTEAEARPLSGEACARPIRVVSLSVAIVRAS